jgi:hypothetical protein
MRVIAEGRRQAAGTAAVVPAAIIPARWERDRSVGVAGPVRIGHWSLEADMYHAIAKRIARKNFERVNQHDFESLLADCVPAVRHQFGGTHALGGVRHDKEALRRWFKRLQTVMPNLNLSVTDVWVKVCHMTRQSLSAGRHRPLCSMAHRIGTVGSMSSRCVGGK